MHSELIRWCASFPRLFIYVVIDTLVTFLNYVASHAFQLWCLFNISISKIHLKFTSMTFFLYLSSGRTKDLSQVRCLVGAWLGWLRYRVTLTYNAHLFHTACQRKERPSSYLSHESWRQPFFFLLFHSCEQSLSAIWPILRHVSFSLVHSLTSLPQLTKIPFNDIIFLWYNNTQREI